MAKAAWGFFLGILATIASAYIVDALQREHEKDSLAYAFVGEISAMAIDKSQTVSTAYLEGLLTELRNKKVWDPRDQPPEKNTVIYDNNGSKLGLLGPCLAHEITLFYARSSRQRENIRTLGSGVYRVFDEQDKEKWLTEYIRKEKEWENLGRSTIEKLNAFIRNEKVSCSP